MKEAVSISRLQSINGIRKRKKFQHQEKRSKAEGKLERFIMSLIISVPVISNQTQILTNI